MLLVALTLFLAPFLVAFSAGLSCLQGLETQAPSDADVVAQLLDKQKVHYF